MRRFLLVSVSLAAVVSLAACGGGSSKTSSPPTGTQSAQPASVTYKPAGANPSISAKMICEAEAEGDIASALQIKTIRVTKPTWVDHVYSCAYVYSNGPIVLAVKELVNAADTTAYFNSLATKYGKRQTINGLAQGAFIANNDDVVVRKDYKVLLVDVSKVPKNFAPATTRLDVAQNIAAVIMSCWTGA
jgi:hypothetical protein